MNTEKFYDIGCLALAAGAVWVLSAAGASADVNPAAPLDFLATAKSAANSSTMTSSGIIGLTNTGASIVAAVSGLGGLSLAGVSGSKLWKATQDENARDGIFRSATGFGLGSLLTALGVMVAYNANLFTS